MKDIFFAIWFFLPAGIANATPIFAAHIPFLNTVNYPLDFSQKIHNTRIFGDHKTIRGMVSGIILGTFTSLILFYFTKYVSNFLPSWYLSINPFLLGFLLSFGALTGDAIKSFFKRRVNLKPGSTWIPFDQIDYILGGLVCGSLVHLLSIAEYVVILIVWTFIHVVSTYSGYFLRLKKQPL